VEVDPGKTTYLSQVTEKLYHNPPWKLNGPSITIVQKLFRYIVVIGYINMTSISDTPILVEAVVAVIVKNNSERNKKTYPPCKLNGRTLMAEILSHHNGRLSSGMALWRVRIFIIFVAQSAIFFPEYNNRLYDKKL
jgi:hypothetical protein